MTSSTCLNGHESGIYPTPTGGDKEPHGPPRRGGGGGGGIVIQTRNGGRARRGDRITRKGPAGDGAWVLRPVSRETCGALAVKAEGKRGLRGGRGLWSERLSPGKEVH